jgi:hypothetical protein
VIWLQAAKVLVARSKLMVLIAKEAETDIASPYGLTSDEYQ